MSSTSIHRLTLHGDIQNGLHGRRHVWSGGKAKILSGIVWHDGVDHQGAHHSERIIVHDTVVSDYDGAFVFHKVDSRNRVAAGIAADVQAVSIGDDFRLRLSVDHRGSWGEGGQYKMGTQKIHHVQSVWFEV